MICPSCGHENIQGLDECENCGADLRTADIPAPGTAFEATMVNVPLAEVQPHAPLTIGSGAAIADAVRQMQGAGVGCLIVEDDGAVSGILTERDLVMKLDDAGYDGATVGQLMTRDPVVLLPDDSVAIAIHKMAVGGFRHIPLVENGHATGIVSARDLFKHILEALG
ncbi:MAG TPA: CBS domain-containing protein [Candidatus Limnocylindrales bacterium]|nr:CBS domain-containing protein [Candidatus Limnocylindrales bacterium]